METTAPNKPKKTKRDIIVIGSSAGGVKALVEFVISLPPQEPKIKKEDLDLLEIELAIARQDNAYRMGIIDKGELTAFSGPDCHGALTKLIEGNLIRFRCPTGHS